MLTKPLLIVAGVSVALIGVLGWLLLRAHEDLGAAELALKNANLVIQQREADMKLSALVIAKLQGRVEQIDATAAPVKERIIHVPVTTSCGPAIAAAVAGVRELLASGAGGPPAGREPAAAVRPAAAPTR